MGQRYTVHRTAVTPANGEDILTLTSASARRIRLIDVNVAGNGSSSAAQHLIIARSITGGVTPGGAITPTPAEHSEQPAAAFTVATTWGTQPTIQTNGIMLGWNALSANRYVTPPGRPNGILEARNGERICIRGSTSGPVTYQPMSISVTVEED